MVFEVYPGNPPDLSDVRKVITEFACGCTWDRSFKHFDSVAKDIAERTHALPGCERIHVGEGGVTLYFAHSVMFSWAELFPARPEEK